MMPLAGLGLIAIPFALSILLCWGMRRLAPKIGLVDKPGGRKAHKAPTPLGGGVAIWLATVMVIGAGALIVYLEPSWLPYELAVHAPGLREKGGDLAVILGLATIIMVMGLIDDRVGLGWKPRLAVQFGVAALLVLRGVRITLFVSGPGEYVMAAVTVVWIVGLTNAFNFLDNMDGLAASVGLIAAALFAGAQIAVQSYFVPAALLILVGSLGGFLVHNRPPARLFMGDAGSNFLGFLLGAFTVAGTFTKQGYSPYSVLTPLLVMAVPIYDMASVILIRIREGRSPFQPDRRHFSHRLVERGLTPARAVATIDLVTLAGGLGALLLHDPGIGLAEALVVVAQTLCLLGVVAALESWNRPAADRSETMASRRRSSTIVRDPRPSPRPMPEPAGFFDVDPEGGARLAELLRKLALGLAVALIAARAYFPSEARSEQETGVGLVWVLAMLVVASIAVAAAWVSGRSRIRVSLADVGVIALVALVCLSARIAAEKRIAVNLAWEWVGLGLTYVILRSLPRSRSESSAIAGVLVATAVAVSSYGLYQVAVEYPVLRALYLKNPVAMLREAGVDPADPAARARFEDRLLGSKEPMSTFALTNSLAGYLVGASALALAVLLDRVSMGRSRLLRIAIAAPPLLILLVCLLLTKSRSAYLGLFAAILILAWRSRRLLPTRAILIGSATLAAALALLIGGAVALKQLDVQILTESTKSLRYRWEYWQGAWGVIHESSAAFWGGHGPGNFSGPYLKYKLPAASEEIADPHNVLLDVWAIAGLPALFALIWALLFGLRDLFGPPKPAGFTPPADAEKESWSGGRVAAWGGVGGLVLVVLLGELDPFRQGDLIARWLVLAIGWGLAVGCGLAIWRRGEVPAAGPGVAFVAIAINLLAAGGIGLASVAILLWSTLALGLNLRDDRPCGRPRFVVGRWLAFGLGMACSIGMGTFAGLIGPFWGAEKKLAEAEMLLARRPPDFDGAQNAYIEASKLDPLMATPWISLADSTFVAWRDLKIVPRRRRLGPGRRRLQTRGRAAPQPAQPPRRTSPGRLRRRDPRPGRGQLPRPAAAPPHGPRRRLLRRRPPLSQQRPAPRRADRCPRRPREVRRRPRRRPHRVGTRRRHAPPRQEAAARRPQAARSVDPGVARAEAGREVGPPNSFPRSAWECRLRRSASSSFREFWSAGTDGPQSVRGAFPRGAWERVMLVSSQYQGFTILV